jgi:hypothetical protein
MMDNQTTEQVTAETAEAEKESVAAAGLGKFKDVAALLEAYSNLEAEFTRRSQKLKELEKANKENGTPAEAASVPAPSPVQEVLDGKRLLDEAMGNKEVKQAIIGEYLANASRNKGVQFITGGVNVTAQRRAPSSVREAGKLAQQFLNNRED